MLWGEWFLTVISITTIIQSIIPRCHTFQRETAQTFSLRFTFDEMQFGILPASKFEATFASNLT